MARTARQQEEYEALISLVQMGIKSYNNGVVYKAPSTTIGQPDHILTVLEGTVTHCSNCKGWAKWGHCLHAIATIRFIAEEQAVSQPVETPAAEVSVIEQAVEVVKATDEKSVRRGYTTRPEIKLDPIRNIPMR